jgi:DNA-directed RNA polymerase alpha subunit
MTKTPGQFEPPTPLTKEEREARKAFRQLDAKKAMTEHDIAQRAFSANRAQSRAVGAGGRRPGANDRSHSRAPDDTPIERAIFSTRIQNALQAAGLKTVGEVREASDEMLVSLPAFGSSSLADLRRKLGLPSTDGVRPLGKKST